MHYTGMTYQTESGQWAWVIYEQGVDIARGAGYETQKAADDDMQAELNQWLEREPS